MCMRKLEVLEYRLLIRRLLLVGKVQKLLEERVALRKFIF